VLAFIFHFFFIFVCVIFKKKKIASVGLWHYPRMQCLGKFWLGKS